MATREGNSLTAAEIKGYIRQLVPLGLKAVILSGGGNPILHKSKSPKLSDDGFDFNDVVDWLHDVMGLEIGVITNGMPLVEYGFSVKSPDRMARRSWKTVRPETLDKLTWVRISMSGLDHKENEVYVPDIDPSKTTLGFSYVAHDIYEVPEEPNHGKVSTEEDLVNNGGEARSVFRFEDRIPTLTKQIDEMVRSHRPRYVRLLPNCLEVEKDQRPLRATPRNSRCNRSKCRLRPVQPPAAPPNCWLGVLHPVLNSDGFVYPCDSCVLNKSAGHKFAEPWRVCRWDKIGELYAASARSLIKDPATLCPGCVFTRSNLLLQAVVDGAPLQSPEPVTHPNFV